MAMSITAPLAIRYAVRDRVKTVVARAARTTRVARARAGYAGSVLSSVCGVGLLWGFGWALLVGGVVSGWSFLHLYPVDEP